MENWFINVLNFYFFIMLNISDIAFYITVTGVFCYSIYEILYLPAFVNDWPAHLHHLEQWLNDGTRNYSNYMHYHGPCTYPAGFLYLYALFFFLTGGSLQLFQFIWALLEVLQFIILRRILQLMKLPTILAVLSVLSNRLHLYNVRVVINDFPSVVMMFLVILWIIQKR